MTLPPNVISNYSTPFCCVPHNPYLKEQNVFSRQKETLMMSLTSHHEGSSLYLVQIRVNRA